MIARRPTAPTVAPLGHNDLSDHERVRRADVRIRSGSVQRDRRGTTGRNLAGVPATVAGGRRVRGHASVGPGDGRASSDGYALRIETVVNELHGVRLGWRGRKFNLRRRRVRSWERSQWRAALSGERERPDRVTIGRRRLRRDTTTGDGDVLNSVQLIGYGRSVCASARLPVPQLLAGASVIRLEVAVRLAVEKQSA